MFPTEYVLNFMILCALKILACNTETSKICDVFTLQMFKILMLHV